MHHVFMSYCREEQHIAQEIEDVLQENGFNCWRDVSSLPVGKAWEDEITEALRGTRAVVVIASDRAADSEWVRKEIEIAQALDKPMIPIKFRENVHEKFVDSLGRLQFVTCPQGEVTPNATRRLLAGLREAGLGVLHEDDDARLNWGHLEDHFGELPRGDGERLERIADVARRSFQATPGPTVWTVHGLRHANGLLYALADLLDESQKANRHDVFCLVAAACLHDIALVAREFRDQDPAAVQHNHAELAANWLTRAAGLPRLNPRETHTITNLLRYHNTSTNPRGLGDDPRLAALAAAFRVANACDAGLSRGPVRLWQRYHEQIAEDEQVYFWLLNAMVERVLVEPDEQTIWVHGRAPTEDLLFIPKQLWREIARRYETVSPFLANWRVEFGGRVDGELERELPIPREQMVTAALSFMSRRLHFLSGPNAHLESSSGLVDSLVAAGRAIADTEYQSGVGAKLECLNDAVDHLLSVRGELHLLHALKADVERAQEQADSEEEKLRQVAAIIAGFEQERSLDLSDRIVSNAIGELPTPPPDRPLRVFVFGKSGPITAFLDRYAGSRRKVQVFTPIMRPVGEGAALHVPAALSEPRHGQIGVVVVPDAAISYVLSGPDEAHGQRGSEMPQAGGCDLVLMGCEAVFVNGDREIVGIGTSLGARPVAELADAAGVPLWVLTDMAKLVAYPARSPWYGAGAIQAVDAEDFMHEEDAARWTQDRGHRYPRSEVVPGELIQYIITDEGAFAPAQAAERVRAEQRADG